MCCLASERTLWIAFFLVADGYQGNRASGTGNSSGLAGDLDAHSMDPVSLTKKRGAIVPGGGNDNGTRAIPANWCASHY